MLGTDGTDRQRTQAWHGRARDGSEEDTTREVRPAGTRVACTMACLGQEVSCRHRAGRRRMRDLLSSCRHYNTACVSSHGQGYRVPFLARGLKQTVVDGLIAATWILETQKWHWKVSWPRSALYQGFPGHYLERKT